MTEDRKKNPGTGNPPDTHEELEGGDYDTAHGERQLTIEEKWQIDQDMGFHIIEPNGRQLIISSSGTEEIGPDHPRWDPLGHPATRR